MKVVTLLVAGCAMMTIAASARDSYPPAPFVQAKTADVEVATRSAITGREIIRGNKKLVVKPGGELILMCDGRELCRLFMYVSTESGGKVNQIAGGDIPCKAGESTVGIDKSSFDAGEKRFTVLGNIPLIKGQDTSLPETAGKFIENIQLLDDGKIAIGFEITVPENHIAKFNHGCIMFRLNKPLYENEKIIFNPGTDKEKEMHVLQKEQFVSLPGAFEYSPGDDIKGFKVNVDGNGRFQIHEACATGDTRFYFDVNALKKKDGKTSLQFTLDMGKTHMVKNANSDNVRGGIDFKAVDDLELPYNSFGKNLMQNPSFEQGVKYCLTWGGAGHEFAGTDNVTADPAQSVFGKHSLKYEMLSGIGSLINILMSPVTLSAGTYTFSLYAKGSAPEKQALQIMIRDNLLWTTSYANKTFGINDTWQRYSITFKLTTPSIAAIYLSPRRGDDSISNIWIDGMQLEKGDTATEFSSPPLESLLLTANEENFFDVNDPINATLRVYSSAPEQSGKVKVTVKNFFSEPVFEKTFPFSTGKDGLCIIPLDFNEKFPQGIYVVKAEFTLGDVLICRDFFRFSIMPYVMKQTGLKTLFADGYAGTKARDAHPGLETYLQRSQKIGVFGDTHAGCISEPMYKIYQKYGMEVIDSVMPNKKIKDNTNARDSLYYYHITSPLDSYGKGLIGDFRLEAGGKLTDEYLMRFENVIAEVVRNYPRVPRWMLFSESDAAIPELSLKDPESWARLQIAFYHAVKSVNPDLKVGNDQPCNIDLARGIRYIEEGLKQINGRIKFDSLGAHTYIVDGPYALDANVEALSTIAAKYGYTAETPFEFSEGLNYGVYSIPQFALRITPAWSGGTQKWHHGALSYDMGWTEKLSAAWFARSYLVLMKHNGRVISQTSGVGDTRYGYDLDARLTPRAYQKIPNTLNNIFGNAKFIKDVSFAPKTRCLIFEDSLNKSPIAAVWSEYGDVDRGLKESPWGIAEFVNEPVEIFDLMDVKRTFAGESEGQVKFPVSPFPFFIRGAPGSIDSFCAAMAGARLQGADTIPLKLVEKVLTPDSMELTVVNEIARTVSGILTSGKIREEIALKPFEKSKILVALPEKLEDDKITKIMMPVSLSEKGGTAVSKKFSFEGFTCLRTAAPKTIDGHLEDWADIPAIQLKNKHVGKPAEVAETKEGDFDGYFKTAWDKDFLYLLVAVKDKMFVHDEYGGKDDGRWNNDCLQIYFDTLCDARGRSATGYDMNDYDYAVFPNKEGNSSIVYRYVSPDSQLTLGVFAPPNHAVEPNIPSAFTKTSDGYVYEVKFPAKYLLPIHLEKNYCMGFSIFVNDRDEGNGAKQSLTLTPPGTGGYNKPHLYPVMLLVEEGK